MKYNLKRIAKEFGIDYGTVWARANSKYASVRWGVENIELPDGSVKQFVPKDKIYLWLDNSSSVGRPSFEFLKTTENAPEQTV